MSVTMEGIIKRWTAKRKTALVVEIIQGKSTVSEASRACDLSPSEIEAWVDDAKRGMENALRANPLDIREQYEKQPKDLREAYGEAKRPCWMRIRQMICSIQQGLWGRWDCSAADQALCLVRRAAADGVLQADQGRAQG
jgi:transposase-like protein